MESVYYFQWADYLVLGILLALSAAIGFYYACTGDKQRTTKEYLLADRNMHWFPVGCSLLASYTSSQTIIGLPGEVYTFGTIILYGHIFKFFVVLGSTTLFLPVLRRLECISSYKYIEMRFGKPLKYTMEVSSLLFVSFQAALVIYGPALSISAVTGINLWFAVLSVTLVALLYTVMGGMKAVLWTDTIQLIIMIIGLLLVLIMGISKIGSFSEIWEVNRVSGRLDMLVPEKFLSIDPRMRNTVWWTILQTIPLYCNVYGIQPGAVLRSLTLKTSRDVSLAFGMLAIGATLFGLVSGMLGLVIFAHFKFCDPVSDGIIRTKDQLYPLYVMELMNHLPGLPGVIMASLLSASLSTLSSMLNALSALVLQDFVRPLKPNLKDKHAAIISKVAAVCLGALAIILVLFARYFGNGLLSMGMTLGGIQNGPVFAVFTLGFFFPIVNQRCAFIGFVAGVAMGAWLGFGNLIRSPYIYEYPTTTAGCNITEVNMLSNLSSPVYDPNTWDPQAHYRTGVDSLYDVSYLLVGPIGCFITIILALICSLFLGTKEGELIEKRLLSRMLFKSCCFMPESWKKRIDYGDNKEGKFNSIELDEGDEISAKET